MKTLIRLDPSSLALWACPRKFEFSNIHGYVSKLSSTPLDFGQALHRAIAAWTVDRLKGVVQPHEYYTKIAVDYFATRLCVKNHPRDIPNLVRALEDYFNSWSRADDFVPLINDDGKAAVEMPFEFPNFYEDDHVTITLCGVIDAIGTMGGDKLRVFKDIKHTSSENIPAYLDSYKNSQQFQFYSYALRRIGWTDYYPPCIVDGVFISRKFQGAKCVRSNILDMQDFLVERTVQRVTDVCAEISRMLVRGGAFTHDFTQCDGKYRRCDFDPVCHIQGQFQALALKSAFTQREYNPATFGD